MKRRGFLGLLAGAAVAPALPAPLGEQISRYVYPAPLLPGPAVAEACSRANPGLLTSIEFRAFLLDGLNKVFEEEYAKHDTEWSELFEDTTNQHARVARACERSRAARMASLFNAYDEPVFYGFGVKE